MEMAQLVCRGCGTPLIYPRGVPTVTCFCCLTINLTRPGMEMAQLACRGCQTPLMYARGVPTVTCLCCGMINLTRPGMEMGQLACRGCQTLLMYARGVPTVTCLCCGTINLTRPEGRLEVGHNDGHVANISPVDIGSTDLQIIKNKDLEVLRKLGSGTFGTVYHGKWRGTDVAIKRINRSCFTGRSSEQERLTVDFWREAEILARLHHPNVVAFYGVVQDGPGGTLATVAEYMVNGSLRNVLLRNNKYLDRRKRLIIARDAAFGMEYLHSKNIVHFDLKCDNLLVNLKDPLRPICKVGDFGLSKIKRNTLVTNAGMGTVPWMAPELFINCRGSKVSEKVDVFSFGIVMWEILTGEIPYANMHQGAIIGGIVSNTLRPPIPSFCDPEWRRLMEQCWATDPKARPTFTQIVSRLRVMHV